MKSVLDDAGIKKPVVDDTADGLIVAAKILYKNLLAVGKSESVAKQVAETTYGVTLPN